MLVAGHNEVGMNFVGYYYYVVFKADVGQFCEFVLAPHTAYGVVRVAEHEQLCSAVYLGFKVLEIKFVTIFGFP